MTFDPSARASHNVSYQPCSIGNGVWIGAGAIVLPGISIAPGCIIGAGDRSHQVNRTRWALSRCPRAPRRDL
ncbi:hypothetical protein [Bradyrhizobium yuanmingense]|uniref:hypothetical protein n=1 Tax=Bradyrhizobium yuanmingense TaxID=108015 RepID=UPI003D2EBAE3